MPARNLRAVPDKPSRVLLYVRVSALMGRGGEDFHSPDVQTSAMRRAIAPAGLREVGVVEDIDQTGRHFNREGIDQIKAMADARQIDAIAVYDLSRLGRNVREALEFIEYLAERGVGVLSASENIDTSTPSGKLMLQQFLSFAEFYSNTVGRNWSAIIVRRAEQGLGHGRPLGYIKKDLALHVHPVDGPAVAEAFRKYAAGRPIGEISRELAAAIGRTVYTNQLKKQLRRDVYRGKVVIHGRVLPGRHEPLVDEETWQLVQDRIARERTVPSRHLGPTWSLVGIIFCPQDHPLYRRPTANRPGGPKINRLECGRGRSTSSETCTIGQPPLDAVEAEVLRQVAEYVRLLRDDVGAQAEKRARAAAARVEKATLGEQLKRVRSAMARIAKEWALLRLTDDVYEETMAELRESETALLTSIASADQVVQLPTPAQMASAGEQLLAMWPEMTVSEKGRALRVVVRRVVVRAPARWREPVGDRVQVFFY